MVWQSRCWRDCAEVVLTAQVLSQPAVLYASGDLAKLSYFEREREMMAKWCGKRFKYDDAGNVLEVTPIDGWTSPVAEAQVWLRRQYCLRL